MKTFSLYGEDHDYTRDLNPSPIFSMYLTPASKIEIEKVIKSIKTDAPGYDDISPKVLLLLSFLFL